jgi:hypothetical protein
MVDGNALCPVRLRGEGRVQHGVDAVLMRVRGSHGHTIVASFDSPTTREKLC